MDDQELPSLGAAFAGAAMAMTGTSLLVGLGVLQESFAVVKAGLQGAVDQVLLASQPASTRRSDNGSEAPTAHFVSDSPLASASASSCTNGAPDLNTAAALDSLGHSVSSAISLLSGGALPQGGAVALTAGSLAQMGAA